MSITALSNHPPRQRIKLVAGLFLVIAMAFNSVAQNLMTPPEPALTPPVHDATSAATPAITTNSDHWAVEDAAARARLPLYKVIPAAATEDLTPANGYPKPE